jgi:DNA-binding transcriptional LysR family regulator
MDAMALPGTADYFPSLVSRVRGASPNISLEPVIFESLLLCLIAGSSNLILRAEEEDLGLVARQVASVSLPHGFRCKPQPSHPLPLVFCFRVAE